MFSWTCSTFETTSNFACFLRTNGSVKFILKFSSVSLNSQSYQNWYFNLSISSNNFFYVAHSLKYCFNIWLCPLWWCSHDFIAWCLLKTKKASIMNDIVHKSFWLSIWSFVASIKWNQIDDVIDWIYIDTWN